MEIEVPREARLLYLERRQKDLGDCSVALKEKDFSVFARVGHQLKGNAEPFGFAELADIGADLEHAAKKNDLESASDATARFQNYLENNQSLS
ncbi:MAG: Hpt domain-containing protein [Bdellovibrionales bacterium]|nr:Hpt domain-containing protein [Bdellovibrionales bacterium]